MGYKKLDMPKVEEAVKNLLVALGEDINREGLKETPRRVAKYWAELLEGEDYILQISVCFKMPCTILGR